MNKPHLSFWQIWNMSFGFLGIQFGFGLQLEPVVKGLFGNDPVKVVMLGGGSLILAAIFTQFVPGTGIREAAPTSARKLETTVGKALNPESVIPPESSS